jgi:hypothetical protein
MLLLPRMWSTDNIEGYINFLNYHNLLLKPEYSEEKLTDIVAQFREATQQLKKIGY